MIKKLFLGFLFTSFVAGNVFAAEVGRGVKRKAEKGSIHPSLLRATKKARTELLEQEALEKEKMIFNVACQFALYKQIEKVLKRGYVTANQKIFEGNERRTPLYFALKEKGRDVVELLLRYGADPYEPFAFYSERHGEAIDSITPLGYACLLGDIELIKPFVAMRCNFTDLDDKRWTPLHYACLYGRYELLKFLFLERVFPVEFFNSFELLDGVNDYFFDVLLMKMYKNDNFLNEREKEDYDNAASIAMLLQVMGVQFNLTFMSDQDYDLIRQRWMDDIDAFEDLVKKDLIESAAKKMGYKTLYAGLRARQRGLKSR